MTVLSLSLYERCVRSETVLLLPGACWGFCPGEREGIWCWGLHKSCTCKYRWSLRKLRAQPSAAEVWGLNLLHAVPLLRFKLCYRCAFRPPFILSVASHLPQKDVLWTQGGSQEAAPVFMAVQLHHFVMLCRSLQLAVLPIPCFSVQLTHRQCFAAEFPASDFPALFGDRCFPSFVLC